MRLFLWLPILVAIVVAAARAEPLPIGRHIEDPNGIALTVTTGEFRRDAIVLAVTIDNPGSSPVQINPSGGFVLRDDMGGIHRLNPPPDNPDLEIPPRSRWSGQLVFIGPVAPTAHALTLSAGGLRGDLPVAAPPATDEGRQVSALDGAALRAGPVTRAGTDCTLPLLATNGSDHTLLINRNRSLVLRDARGAAAPLRPPTDNWELVVPLGNRLDANLVFNCQALATDGPLTLAGTDTGLPPLALPPAQRRANAPPPTAPSSRATVTPLPASRLAPAPASTNPAAQVAKAPAVEPTPPTEKAAAGADDHLIAALHAHKTERGLRLALSADALFAAGSDRLEPAALQRLQRLAALIAAAGMHEVVVTVHADAAAERARAVVAWLAHHVAAPPPHFVAHGEPADQPKDDASADPGAAEATAAARKPWVDVILRRDYLVPNSRSPASPSPGKM